MDGVVFVVVEPSPSFPYSPSPQDQRVIPSADKASVCPRLQTTCCDIHVVEIYFGHRNQLSERQIQKSTDYNSILTLDFSLSIIIFWTLIRLIMVNKHCKVTPKLNIKHVYHKTSKLFLI